MLRRLSLFGLSLVLAMGAVAGFERAAGWADAAPAGANSLAARQELHDTMRRLWTDHVLWTRQFIVSELADLPDLDAATTRLLANQGDIGDAIKPFFGTDAGDALTALLEEHILIAATLVAALEDGDTAGAEEAAAAWQANADDIATFLSEANPRAWPFEEMQAMLYEHLDLTSQEVQARLDEQWETDVAVFDEILTQALEMADMLTEGLLPGANRK